MLQEAEAYEAEKIAKAKGETERFEQLLTEYEKNPAITRKRLYLEAKEKLYSGSNKILIESEKNAAQFYMPLPSAIQQQTPAPTKNVIDQTTSDSNTVDKSGTRSNSLTDIRPSRSKQ